jgi:hypothetical protein
VQTDRLVIGGGAAGMSAAPAARRSIPFGRSSSWSPAASPAYGLCGLPYYLSGVVRHSDAPPACPPAFFREQRRIDRRLHSAVRLDPHRHVVHYLAGGRGHRLGYQQVVVTADGTPTRPSIHGLHHPRVFGVRTLEDVISLRGLLDAGLIGRALVVGTGYLRLEMAAASVHQGVRAHPRRSGGGWAVAIATTAVGKSRATYYSGTDAVHVRLLYETGGRLLHAQLVGGWGVVKRIDAVGVALHAGLNVDDLTGLDLSCAPHASVYEPVLLAAQAAGAHEPIPA